MTAVAYIKYKTFLQRSPASRKESWWIFAPHTEAREDLIIMLSKALRVGSLAKCIRPVVSASSVLRRGIETQVPSGSSASHPGDLKLVTGKRTYLFLNTFLVHLLLTSLFFNLLNSFRLDIAHFVPNAKRCFLKKRKVAGLKKNHFFGSDNKYPSIL